MITALKKKVTAFIEAEPGYRPMTEFTNTDLGIEAPPRDKYLVTYSEKVDGLEKVSRYCFPLKKDADRFFNRVVSDGGQEVILSLIIKG